jgi:DNA-binding NarL/FixJ family response regulator
LLTDTSSAPKHCSWKILIADDHELIRRGTRSLLESRFGTNVWEAENGKEAIEKARALRPHLVILDVSMPLLDGFSAASEIKKFAPETQILIVSFSKTDAFAEVARKIGVAGYFTKSESAGDLLTAVYSLLTTPELPG